MSQALTMSRTAAAMSAIGAKPDIRNAVAGADHRKAADEEALASGLRDQPGAKRVIGAEQHQWLFRSSAASRNFWPVGESVPDHIDRLTGWSAQRLNGSTFCAKRTNWNMMYGADGEEDDVEHARNGRRRSQTDWRCAQEPAKAAPNTSAPIKIAALITVMTLIQTMRRLPAGTGPGGFGIHGRSGPILRPQCRSKHRP